MVRKYRHKKKSQLLVWFCLLMVVLVNVAGLQEVTRAQTTQCDVALDDGQQRLAKVPSTEVVSMERFQHEYADGPSDRPFGYRFVLSGIGTETVMTSPVFLTSISSAITSNCGDVGLVQFGVDQTDWGAEFGVMAKVDQFRCIEPGNGVIPKWGETVCP